jgi:hypothetical protein
MFANLMLLALSLGLTIPASAIGLVLLGRVVAQLATLGYEVVKELRR